jgi:HAD superfamily hydrolase (TIGR01549 family)
MLKAILLDIDGTLVRSNDEHAQAWAEVLKRYGYDVPWTQVRRWIGMGGDKILPRVDERLNKEEEPGKSISRDRQRLFLEEYVHRLQPQPGARELLECFKERGLARVAATSANREELGAILEAGKIANEIDVATTSDDVDRSKPDPDIIESALKKMSIGRNEAVYLGDTPYDVSASSKARIPIIALTCGGWSEEDLSSAAEIYATPADLLKRIEQSAIGRTR